MAKRLTFNLDGKEVKGKNTLVLEIVKQYVERNPNVTAAGLKKVFNEKALLRGGQVITLKADAEKDTANIDDNGSNYFLKDAIRLANGEEVVVWCYWPDRFFKPFIKMAKEDLGYKIEGVGEGNQITIEISANGWEVFTKELEEEEVELAENDELEIDKYELESVMYLDRDSFNRIYVTENENRTQVFVEDEENNEMIDEEDHNIVSCKGKSFASFEGAKMRMFAETEIDGAFDVNKLRFETKKYVASVEGENEMEFLAVVGLKYAGNSIDDFEIENEDTVGCDFEGVVDGCL